MKRGRMNGWRAAGLLRSSTATEVRQPSPRWSCPDRQAVVGSGLGWTGLRLKSPWWAGHFLSVGMPESQPGQLAAIISPVRNQGGQRAAIISTALAIRRARVSGFFASLIAATCSRR